MINLLSGRKMTEMSRLAIRRIFHYVGRWFQAPRELVVKAMTPNQLINLLLTPAV